MSPTSSAKHTCSTAQLVAIGILALGLATFLAVLHSIRTTPPLLPSPPLRPLKLIIISDWHTHPDYSTLVRPGWPCSCSNSSFGKLSCALQQPASAYGQVGCDSPERLTRASLEAAAAAVPDPDLVIVLGDLVWHESQSEASTQELFHQMSRAIADAFPSRPMACTVPLGNNDVYPGYHVNNSDRLYYARQAAVAREFCGTTQPQPQPKIPNPKPNPNPQTRP